MGALNALAEFLAVHVEGPSAAEAALYGVEYGVGGFVGFRADAEEFIHCFQGWARYVFCYRYRAPGNIFFSLFSLGTCTSPVSSHYTTVPVNFPVN